MSGITLEEHRKIVLAEHHPAHRPYYEMLWETGGSQTDIASLHRNQVDVRQGVIMYQRKKLEGKNVAGVILLIGPRLQKVLDQLPQEGWLFPEIRPRREEERAARFCKVCQPAGVGGDEHWMWVARVLGRLDEYWLAHACYWLPLF